MLSDVKIPQSISLKSLLADPKKEEIDTTNLPQTDFDQETLIKYWEQYVYSIKSSDLDIFSSLISYQPILKENFQIEIVFGSALQISEFQQRKQVILDFLRKKLNNYHLNITEILDVKVVKEIAVTPNDKFKKLLEKNPLLAELKNKLDLGF